MSGLASGRFYRQGREILGATALGPYGGILTMFSQGLNMVDKALDVPAGQPGGGAPKQQQQQTAKQQQEIQQAAIKAALEEQKKQQAESKRNTLIVIAAGAGVVALGGVTWLALGRRK